MSEKQHEEIAVGDYFLYSESYGGSPEDKGVHVGMAYGEVIRVERTPGDDESGEVLTVEVLIMQSETIPSMINTNLVLAFERRTGKADDTGR